MDQQHYSCDQVVARLDDYLDRELSAEEIAKVKEHLEECIACARQYAFEATFVREVTDRLRHIDAPPEFVRKVLRAISAS